MTTLDLTRDVVVLSKGDAYAVALDPDLMTQGWQGGQGVRWTTSPTDEFRVARSDGLYGGFLLWGSNESSDQYIAYIQQQPQYGYGILCTGTWIMATRTFEQYTYASRQVPPLVPLVYSPTDRLRFSLRGFWTKEDEWTLSGDPRAPNTFTLGNVMQAVVNSDTGVPYLLIQSGI